MSSETHDGAHSGMKPMYIVWLGLLVATLIEVVLAYFHLPLLAMLVILLGLSIFKAVLIMAWFMHLKFERLSLVLTLVPAMVICMLLLTAIYPDAFRINDLDVSRSPAVGQAADAPSGGAGH